MARQRVEWLSLIDEINARIKGVDAWLDERAKRDERVLRLQTHPRIGLLTSPGWYTPPVAGRRGKGLAA